VAARPIRACRCRDHSDRDYKGQALRVEVLAEGFAYGRQVYKSLSAVAKAVTGAHCNGYWFFRSALTGRGGAA